jgi:DNA gyrase subunit B
VVETQRFDDQNKGHVYSMRFERGKAVSPLEIVGETTRTGTRVEFKPDPEIFADTSFRTETLITRLRELAYLNEGLRIQFVDAAATRSSASPTDCAPLLST